MFIFTGAVYGWLPNQLPLKTIPNVVCPIPAKCILPPSQRLFSLLFLQVSREVGSLYIEIIQLGKDKLKVL
jgi:hypothetical protein